MPRWKPFLLAAAAALLTVGTVAAQPLLDHCFEMPGVGVMYNANRPGYTYRSFIELQSGCGACEQACHDEGERCFAWTCFHPTHFGAGGVLPGPVPIACHLKSELPLASPNRCAPPPRAPTRGNGVHDDRCYTSTQAPMDLPPRPERAHGVLTTISIADPNFALTVGQELLVEAALLAEIEAHREEWAGILFLRVIPECGGVGLVTDPPAAVGAGPGLVTGPGARDAFEAMRRAHQVDFVDFESIPTGVHDGLRLGGPARDIWVRLRTTEIRWPPPSRVAPAGTPVAVLPHDFVRSPLNHRLMGVREGGIPDGQSKYELVFTPPVSHVGLLRMWNTNSLTRFYNEAGVLLAEHRNTTNHEFVGYIADRLENRVHRVEFDGLPTEPGRVYQVGEVDDLYVGDVAFR